MAINLVGFVLALVIIGFGCDWVISTLVKKSQKNIDAVYASEMLSGIGQHEIKAFLRVLQSSGNNETALFTPLKHVCNIVSIYIRLGGTHDEVNAIIKTIRSTMASQKRPIPVVQFAGPEETPFREWLFNDKSRISFVGIKELDLYYTFDRRHTDSLKKEIRVPEVQSS